MKPVQQVLRVHAPRELADRIAPIGQEGDRVYHSIVRPEEQRANNKLIRPSADYIGPEPRAFTPMDDR
jgi:hypothetical protein